MTSHVQVPGLYKIFDEILVNAADNKQRDRSMNKLAVTIDPAANTLSVWNNGRAVPVVVHAEHGVYVPELIFGHLLTSSNYDDDEKKGTAVKGRLELVKLADAMHYRAIRIDNSDYVLTVRHHLYPTLFHNSNDRSHGRPQRLRCQAGKHLFHGIHDRDSGHQKRKEVRADIPREHDRQGRADDHAI